MFLNIKIKLKQISANGAGTLIAGAEPFILKTKQKILKKKKPNKTK